MPKQPNEMKVVELRAALKAQGLPTDGRKKDLLNRLLDAVANRDVIDIAYVTDYVPSNSADTQFEVFFPATGKFWLAYSEKEIRDLSIDDFISVRQRVSAEMMNTIYRLHKVALQLVPYSIYLEYRHMFEVNPGTLAMTTYAKVS